MESTPTWAPIVKKSIKNMLYRNGYDDDLAEFITRDRLEEIWIKNVPRDQLDLLPITTCLRVLSILIVSNWKRWDSLEDLLRTSWVRSSEYEEEELDSRSEGRSLTKGWRTISTSSQRSTIGDTVSFADKYLPFTPREVRSSLPLLGSEDVKKNFKERQHIFNPVVIQEDVNLTHTASKARLPFVRESGHRSGSYGAVTKVRIAKGHYKFSSKGNKYDFNKEEFDAARKKFILAADYVREKNNLALIRQNGLKTNSRIMTSFAGITIGQECNLLFEWADGDLERFLSGEYLPGVTTHKITPLWLLKEASGIAWALSFLHTKLWDDVNSRQIQLSHLDLKPNNILLMRDEKHPIGKFMLTDFGISSAEPHQLITSKDFYKKTMSNYPQVGSDDIVPNEFQPPEAESRFRKSQKLYHPSCDIWSFGAVLINILVFARGGPQYVKYLFALLHDEPDRDPDGVYRAGRYYRCLHSKSLPEIHPDLVNWLQLLADQRHGWLLLLWKYIKDFMLLTIPEERSERTNSTEVLSTLQSCLNQVENYNIWDDAPELPMPRLKRREPSPTLRISSSIQSTHSQHVSRKPLNSAIPAIKITPSLGQINEDEITPAPEPQLGKEVLRGESAHSGATNSSGPQFESLPTVSSAKSARIIPNGAQCDLSRQLASGRKEVMKGVILSPDGLRVAFWSNQKAAVFHNANNSALFTNESDTYPVAGSSRAIEWAQVCLAGSFLMLRRGPTSSESNGIVELHSLRTPKAQCKLRWSNVPNAKNIDGLDISIQGSVAFRIDRRILAYTSDGSPLVDFQVSASENILGVSFDRTGSVLVAVCLTTWIMWNLNTSEALPLRKASAGAAHNLAERDHSGFRPNILPLTQGLNILLASGGRIVFIPTVANTPVMPFSLGMTPLALALSEDDKRLCFVYCKKDWGPKLTLRCYKVIEQGYCELDKDSKEEHTLKAVRKVTGAKPSLCVLSLSDNYVAMIASAEGKVECVAFD